MFKISLLKRLQSLLQENARINNDLMDAFNQCEGFFDSLPALVDEESRKDDEEVRQLLLEDGWVTRGMIDQTRQAVDSCLELVNRLMFPNQEDTCKMGEPVGTPVDESEMPVKDESEMPVKDESEMPVKDPEEPKGSKERAATFMEIPHTMTKSEVQKVINAPITSANLDKKFAVMMGVLNKELPMPDKI